MARKGLVHRGGQKGVRHGGRKKGTPNKITLDLIKCLEERNYDPIKSLLKIVKRLMPGDQARVHMHMMDYIYPKRKPIDAAGGSDENLNVYVYDTQFGTEEASAETVQAALGPKTDSPIK